jgi:hypothetical protein
MIFLFALAPGKAGALDNIHTCNIPSMNAAGIRSDN